MLKIAQLKTMIRFTNLWMLINSEFQSIQFIKMRQKTDLTW